MVPLDLEGLKGRLQAHFSDGLVVVVGCGLSAAEGLPSMPELAGALRARLNGGLDGATRREWEVIENDLNGGMDLETTLLHHPPSDQLLPLIRSVTADEFMAAERTVVSEVIARGRQLRFARLLPHLNPHPTNPLPVVTTNYDRLIEVATEQCGWGVDSGFLGTHCGALSPKASHKAFYDGFHTHGTKVVGVRYRKRIMLAKPHGSLD